MNTKNQPQALEIDIKTYRLEEMSDAMKASLANVDDVIRQQNSLIEVILSSAKANEFREFVKDIEAQIDRLTSQQATLRMKIALIDKVINKCKENEEIEQTISMFIKAIGMFEE